MSWVTTDQGLIIPAGTDQAAVPTVLGSLVGADPTSGASIGGTGVESRLVKRYQSTADRAARNPSPAVGELSYRVDLGGYEYFKSGSWQSLVGATGALGVVGGMIFSTASHNWNSVTTVEAVLTSAGGSAITSSITLAANRRYRISAKINGAIGSTTATLVVHIRETNVAGNIVAEAVWPIDGVAGKTFIIEGTLETGVSTSKVYCVSANTSTGTATFVSGTAFSPTWIQVEDIGAAGVLSQVAWP